MADTSFAALRARLEKMPDGGLEPPNVDPRAAALAAVMVSEFVAKDGVRKRFQRVGESGELDVAHIADLALVARGVLQIIPKLGRHDGPASLPPVAPEALTALTAARALVAAMVSVVLGGADEILEARPLAEYVKLGDDAVETAQNLRLLAGFYGEYGEILSSLGGKYDERDGEKARATARSIEVSIAATDSAERKEWRRWLLRAWPLLETAYEEVCRGGRFIFYRERPLYKFPPLLSVGASSRRLRRSEAASAKLAPAAASPKPQEDVEKDWFKKTPIMVGGRPITLPKKAAAPPPPRAAQADPFKAMLVAPEGDVTARELEKDPFPTGPALDSAPEAPASSKRSADVAVSAGEAALDGDLGDLADLDLASLPVQELVVDVEPDAPEPEPVKRKGPPSKLPPRKPPLPPRKPVLPLDVTPIPDDEPPPAPAPSATAPVDDDAPELEVAAASVPAPPPSAPPAPPSVKPPSAKAPPSPRAPFVSPDEGTVDLGAELAAELGDDGDLAPLSAPPASLPEPITAREPPPSAPEPVPPPKPPVRTPLAAVPSAASAADRPRRAASRFRVTLKLTMASDDEIGVGATENLSESGAFIATPLPRASGSKLALIIAHPETGDTIKLEALVRWGRPARRGVGLEAGMGVEFIDVTDEQRATIKQMLAP